MDSLALQPTLDQLGIRVPRALWVHLERQVKREPLVTQDPLDRRDLVDFEVSRAQQGPLDPRACRDSLDLLEPSDHKDHRVSRDPLHLSTRVRRGLRDLRVELDQRVRQVSREPLD